MACQGGGSLTAFTAGALKRILKEKNEKYEIVALSGASGGAVCALLAWYGLLTNDRDKAIRLLDSFWRDISVSSPQDLLLNNWLIWASRSSDFAPVPEISPYYYPDWAQEYLRGLLEKYVEFEKLKQLINSSSPDMFVGAVDVLSGEFKTFVNNQINADVMLASAALPDIFRAVRVDKTLYWDGLFSHNPPIMCLIEDAKVKPDELWVIHINPDTIRNEPVSIGDIRHRRNTLSGNLSLHQELDLINRINKWIKAGYIQGSEFKLCEVRFIKMLYDLDKESKMDRSQPFINHMMNYGEEQAQKFLAQLAI